MVELAGNATAYDAAYLALAERLSVSHLDRGREARRGAGGALLIHRRELTPSVEPHVLGRVKLEPGESVWFRSDSSQVVEEPEEERDAEDHEVGQGYRG